ncbi:hypothetical protein [Ekhidna sp.]
MEKHRQNSFERGIIKVVSLIGVVRFIIALFVNKPSVHGYADLYLDISSLIVFLIGFLLIQFKSKRRWLVSLFFIPLMILLWLSFYFHNGLTSSTEVNAFAIVVVLSLTMQRRLPILFVGIFIIGVFVTLSIVEPKNIEYLDPSDYYTTTFTLLFISLAIIWMTFHAKNVFTASRNKLKDINQKLVVQSEEIKQKNKQLREQNEKLNQLKSELEKKVLERTKKLNEQKSSIEEYLQLTMIELIKPYEKTISTIQKLENPNEDYLIKLIIESGEKLEIEINNLKTRLIESHE